MVNRVPVLQPGPRLDLSLPEGSLRVATIVAQDADGEAITYAIAGGPDASRFRLVAGNGLEFITPPDFEAPSDHDGDNVYRLDIIARDGRDLNDPFSTLDLATWWRADWPRHDVFNNDWSPSQVSIVDGALTLTLQGSMPSNPATWVSGQYFTQQPLHYGRYEARLKASGEKGVINGFFVYTGPAEGTAHHEIDVEILGDDPTRMQVNYWTDGHEHPTWIDLGFDASSDYHTYAFEWQPEYIRWYVDGVLRHEETGARGPLPSLPGKLMFNLWASRNTQGWSSDQYDGTTTRLQVDSVRYEAFDRMTVNVTITDIIEPTPTPAPTPAPTPTPTSMPTPDATGSSTPNRQVIDLPAAIVEQQILADRGIVRLEVQPKASAPPSSSAITLPAFMPSDDIEQAIDAVLPPGVRMQSIASLNPLPISAAQVQLAEALRTFGLPLPSPLLAAPTLIASLELSAQQPLRQVLVLSDSADALSIALLVDGRQLPTGSAIHFAGIEHIWLMGDGLMVTLADEEGSTLIAGDGTQWIIAGRGHDRVSTGAGHDLLAGADGQDVLDGGAGDDRLYGGRGDDRLVGGEGNDLLQGGTAESGQWTLSLDRLGTLSFRFTAALPEAALWATRTMPAATMATDPRFALARFESSRLTEIALLYAAVTGERPTAELLVHFAISDFSSAALCQLAFDYYAQKNPVWQELALADQLRMLMRQVWGKTNESLIASGIAYFSAGGSWSEALGILAQHPTARARWTDHQGHLVLTAPFSLGEMGWEPRSGADTLLGGPGNDTLIGGDGNDSLDGGEGLDWAVYFGALTDYRLQVVASSTHPGETEILLQHLPTGDVDTLRQIEYLAVGGSAYALPTNLAAGNQGLLADFVTLIGIRPDGTALP